MKNPPHGLPASRAKAGYDPGKSPDPRQIDPYWAGAEERQRNPLDGRARLGAVTYQGPQHACGAGEKPAGKAAGHRYRASLGYGSGR